MWGDRVHGHGAGRCEWTVEIVRWVERGGEGREVERDGEAAAAVVAQDGTEGKEDVQRERGGNGGQSHTSDFDRHKKRRLLHSLRTSRHDLTLTNRVNLHELSQASVS